MSKTPLYMIGGPTASGKTAAALELARRVGGVIINADAMQVYRGVPLLTAQPSPEEKAEIPHKLFEVFDASEKSSAGRWLAMAKEAISQATQAGQMPILVGGTGMYFGALMGGLAEIPAIPDEVRAEVSELYDTAGHDAFRAKLAALDPDSAARMAPNDRQRLIRAYEVAFHTGKTLGQWQKEGEVSSIETTHEVHRQCLMPDRAELYARCDARFLKMMEMGALDEVRELLDHLGAHQNQTTTSFSASPRILGTSYPQSRWCPLPLEGRDRVGVGEENTVFVYGEADPPPEKTKDLLKKQAQVFSSSPSRGEGQKGNDGNSLPALKTLGVPELAAHLRGELSLDEAILKAQQSTRNYAKRQCTWFRNQWEAVSENG